MYMNGSEDRIAWNASVDFFFLNKKMLQFSVWFDLEFQSSSDTVSNGENVLLKDFVFLFSNLNYAVAL